MVPDNEDVQHQRRDLRCDKLDTDTIFFEPPILVDNPGARQDVFGIENFQSIEENNMADHEQRIVDKESNDSLYDNAYMDFEEDERDPLELDHPSPNFETYDHWNEIKLEQPEQPNENGPTPTQPTTDLNLYEMIESISKLANYSR